MAIFDPVVEPAAHLPTIKISQLSHRDGIGSQAVGDDLVRPTVALQRLLHERQSRSFVALLCDEALQDLAFVIDRAPQVMPLAIDLHEHLIKMPFPMPETPHAVHPLPANVGREQRPEPVPPEPHRLVTQANAALEEQVLDVPQAQRETHIHHDHQPDDLW